jgi:RNA polymerase sigma-70 factor (ECF subfamily)
MESAARGRRANSFAPGAVLAVAPQAGAVFGKRDSGSKPNFPSIENLRVQLQSFGTVPDRGSLVADRGSGGLGSLVTRVDPHFRMAPDPKPSRAPLSPSPAGTSVSTSGPEKAQLSGQPGVEISVSTAALDRGVLMAAGTPQASASFSTAVEGTSDAQIMLRAKAGDQSAFDYLVQKYRRPIISFMYRMARNTAAAEDLAQEVFLRVYRSRESYEASAKFTTWLYRIATNLAVNHARDTRHERPEVTVSLDEPDEETGATLELPDGALTAEQAIVRRERLMAIRSKVEALPEQQKLAVIMHKYQQMDYKEIAEVLKKSESATKSLLFRAYETLREQLKEFV